MNDAFVGIDVAFAKKKRLPIVVCTWHGRTLTPLPLREVTAVRPPLGRGNVEALNPAAVGEFANQTVSYLHAIESGCGVKIRRVAIDAPSDPKRDGAARREAEICLDRRRISCITTPSQSEFGAIRQKALAYLEAGGTPSGIPHANQLWMLVGFALFQNLRSHWDCLEVFPQATAVGLGAGGLHKTDSAGVRDQLRSAAAFTGWPSPATPLSLFNIAYGSLHDKLDAYLAAWVAALDDGNRIGLGQAPSDLIWVPTVASGA